MLFKVNPDKYVIRALIQLWDPDRVVFVFKDFELTPTLEEICYFTNLKYRGRGVNGEELTLVPMILVEIFRALEKCKRGKANFFEVPRSRETFHEWNNILKIDIGNGPERKFIKYQVWLREDRNSISPEGEQGFEDIGTMIWIRHSHLGTKVVTPEMWAQMETIM
ncbi:hypothetical protein H5410_019377 [Solanum commersonii]|uniref:DUF7745 domain-containing protein n=1 Tax=Solanum commersonii TaxID=4109 RepID=A0A9J5Z845_SOLCO|nr:hypothetical protein H5410_019377 [Solanum commersonii]